MLIKSKYFPSSRKEMVQFITNKPKVTLEVGCREGLFTKEIKKHFNIKETWGIEPDVDILEEAQKNIDKIIIDFFNKDINLPKNYFDLIIFNDVLEHMYDPWESLIKAKSLLSENGIIIASIPNIRHKSIIKNLLFKDSFTYQSAGILDITHIRFFTKTTMIDLFQSTGFEVIDIKPVILIKKRRWYKKITQLHRKIFNIITLYKFESLQYAQYAITAKAKR